TQSRTKDAVYSNDRPHPRGRQGATEETAAYGEADLRAASGRTRLHRRHHDREGLRGRLAAAGSGDVRTAGASARACSGRRDAPPEASNAAGGERSDECPHHGPARDWSSQAKRARQEPIRAESAVEPTRSENITVT